MFTTEITFGRGDSEPVPVTDPTPGHRDRALRGRVGSGGSSCLMREASCRNRRCSAPSTASSSTGPAWASAGAGVATRDCAWADGRDCPCEAAEAAPPTNSGAAAAFGVAPTNEEAAGSSTLFNARPTHGQAEHTQFRSQSKAAAASETSSTDRRCPRGHYASRSFWTQTTAAATSEYTSRGRRRRKRARNYLITRPYIRTEAMETPTASSQCGTSRQHTRVHPAGLCRHQARPE